MSNRIKNPSRKYHLSFSQQEKLKLDKEYWDKIKTGKYNRFSLVRCLVNGTPTSLIVETVVSDSGDVFATPLFVGVTDDMSLEHVYEDDGEL